MGKIMRWHPPLWGSTQVVSLRGLLVAIMTGDEPMV